MAPAGSLRLCVFDSRRGQQEGHELDKILFFYPLDFPLTSQLSLVGLTEGLITFSRIFSPMYPCDFMEAEKHSHVFYECEPNIWMVMVVEKEEQDARDNAYRNLLKEMHNIFRIFYGTISTLLENNPPADFVRNCLYSLVPDYIGDIVSGKTLWLPTVSDALSEHGTVRILSLDPDAQLDTQSLLGLLDSWIGSGSALHSMVLFHNYIISSTLSPEDTTALYAYAVLRMQPTAISQSYAQGSKRSYTRHSMLNSVVSSFVHEPKVKTASARETSIQDRSVCQPLLQDAWWQDSDGFLATNAWGTTDSQSNVIPTVWIQGNERMQLCAYQHRALTLIMLIPFSSDSETVLVFKKQILEKAADRIQRLEEKLTRQWGGNNALHVPGYRYMLYDLNRRTVKASPSSKVATLAKVHILITHTHTHTSWQDSLAVLNKVREEFDTEKGRHERSSTGNVRDSELCLRTKNNAWVSIRARTGYELYVVLEKASDTLLLASDAIEKFNRRHCEGRLSSD